MTRFTIVLLLNSETRQEAEDFRPKIAEFQQILPENIEFILAHRAFSIDSSNSTSSNDFGLSNIEKYHEIVNSMKNTTYRLEFERILKEKCLRNLAKSTGIYKIMLADDADDLGRLTLAQLCLGRGGSLSSLVSVFDKRTSSSLIFIRPLREISKKEISLVNQLQEYKSIDFPANFSKIPNSSIQKLTDDFVNILEGEKFYSTINTVLSTAGKIHNLSENFKNICKFCEIENCSDCLCETCQQIQIDCSLLNLVQFS
ncbi:unnamed protein product [Caenorhabditis angaria]|uniref:Uncharacterized protein n=1 Tax=Caenorhabditis angaria TaxID=860376 RepID=A0A9P1MXF5_9PELO|nr:unnamed protein product [Caenorhabditis angaria]